MRKSTSLPLARGATESPGDSTQYGAASLLSDGGRGTCKAGL